MRSFDLTPLFRSTIGFDRLADMLDSVGQYDPGATYPPYNIERTNENHYRISLAVAGFGEDELSIEAREHTLTVKGEKADENGDGEGEYLYRGIAKRAFERRFQLAENVEVRGARLVNGLLHVDLERVVPEEKKPRRIPIAADRQDGKVIDARANAA